VAHQNADCSISIVDATLLCFLLASSSLSFTFFGMLSYIDPILLFLVAFFFAGRETKSGIVVNVCPDMARRVGTDGKVKPAA